MYDFKALSNSSVIWLSFELFTFAEYIASFNLSFSCATSDISFASFALFITPLSPNKAPIDIEAKIIRITIVTTNAIKVIPLCFLVYIR